MAPPATRTRSSEPVEVSETSHADQGTLRVWAFFPSVLLVTNSVPSQLQTHQARGSGSLHSQKGLLKMSKRQKGSMQRGKSVMGRYVGSVWKYPKIQAQSIRALMLF